MVEINSSVEIDVPFYDVDAMEIVWHGHYVKYMEIARCHLLDKINYNYEQMRISGYAWPIIDMRIKYVKPLKFRQKVLVHAQLVEVEYGMKIEFLFVDKESGIKLTQGYTKQVAINIKTKEMCLLSPEILHQKIGAYVES